MELLANTHNPRADKFKPLLSQIILTQVLPLFKPVAKKEIDLNLTTTNQQLTMSSQEIADLVESRHDNVRTTIERLAAKGIISFTATQEYGQNNGLGKSKLKTVYHVNKRDSHVVVAQLSPEFTARLVDRWQELEEGLQSGKNNIQLVVPQSLPEALRLAASLAEEKQQLQYERDEAIRTKSQINDRQVATALSTAGVLALRVKRLEAQLGTVKNTPVKFATVMAIESRVVSLKASGRKLANYCRKMGLKFKAVPDARFGKVNTYPAQAWKEVYNIDINRILGV